MEEDWCFCRAAALHKRKATVCVRVRERQGGWESPNKMISFARKLPGGKQKGGREGGVRGEGGDKLSLVDKPVLALAVTHVHDL